MSDDHPQNDTHGAGLFPATAGPDGVAVSVLVEPAATRMLRLYRSVHTPPVLTNPLRAWWENRIANGIAQDREVRGTWVVDVETDGGQHFRIKVASRADAIAQANEIHVGVKKDGAGYLTRFER